MQAKDKVALFVMRAQPFHLGHLKVIKDILKENKKIIIIIGSAQAKNTEENPFSAQERKEMIKKALENEHIKNYDIFFVPDFNDDKLWTLTIKKLCKFDSVYSRNPWTIKCFQRNGIKVKPHKLYQKAKYSGEEIRRRILNNEKWEQLVPETVTKYIKEIDGEARIRKLMY